MFEALRADPCRILEILLDPRAIHRIWRNWRLRGTKSIFDEISMEESKHDGDLQTSSNSISHSLEPIGSILVIDATIPRYDRDAGGKSSFLYLKIFIEMGFEVFFMPNDQLRREPYATELEILGVKLLIGSGFRCGRWKRWLKKNSVKINYVIINRPNIAKRYLEPVSEIICVKIIYFGCDLRSLREWRHFEMTKDKFFQSESDYWEGIEKYIISKVNVAYFFSEEETKIVAKWNGGRVARTIPLYPLDARQAYGCSYEKRFNLLFVGGFSHQPNVDGIIWFVNEIYPVIRDHIEDITLIIVGLNPPNELFGIPGLKMTGYITDKELIQLYSESRVVIAPLRFGAGIKGKVVEALLHHVPLVTTSIGSEGMIESDAVMAVSDSPVNFANAVLRLYLDRDSWESKREAMKTYVENNFSAEKVKSILRQDMTTGFHHPQASTAMSLEVE